MTTFQRNIMSTVLGTLICLTLIRFCSTKNFFDNLDLSTQTLNPAVTGFKITGNAANYYLGQSASTAGDINGDGYDDIIVGAWGKDGLKGVAYVIYGREESSFLDLDLSTAILDPLTTGFVITGNNAASERFGWSVSTARDINKDGFDDIIVGAWARSSSQGAAYVIYGGPKSTMSNIVLGSTTLDPTSTGFMITGNAASDQFGYSVSTAGDINKDGYDDIIVGARTKNSGQGAAYVIYGRAKSSMSDIVLSSTPLDPLTTGFMITGNGGNFGTPVNTAGDINNDGYGDIIVGASSKNIQQGAAYVIYGGPKSTMSHIDLSSTTLDPTSTGFIIIGNAAWDYLGTSVGTAGYINKDGFDDILVGGWGKNGYQGTAHVIYGGPKSSMSNIDLSTQTLYPLTTGFMITGYAANDGFGISASTAGDINGDGYSDIIVGARGKSGNKGAAYVVYGGAKSAMSNIVLSSTPLDPLTTGFMISGSAANDYLGFSVSTAGDINKDGYDDIIVATAWKNGYQGAAYVIYASCSKDCLQCSSKSICTQCKSSYIMHKSECFASCPETTRATSASTCEDCPANCKHCSSATVCTECKDSYISYQSQCLDSCPGGMYLSTTTCQYCQSPCDHCTSASVCTKCVSPSALYGSQCLISCPKTMFNSNNVCKDCPSYCSSCTSGETCDVCFEGFTLSNSLCILPSAPTPTPTPDSSPSKEAEEEKVTQEKATQAISSATQGIGSVVSVGSSIFPLSALVSKIIQNTRYMNISVTSDLAEIYQTWQTDIISWDVPNLMTDLDHFETSPPLFAQYDIDSPFLVNFWPTLINIGIGISTFITCIILRKFCEHKKYEGWAYSLLLKLVAGSFNFALVQAYACLDDILFYLVLDIKTNPSNSFFSRGSMASAVIFLALGCLLVFFNFWTVKKYQDIKSQGARSIEAFNERNKYWGLFYSDFNDEDLWSQSFFAILIIRSSLSSLIITVLYEYPLVQTSYLVILDIAIISFLYFQKPFSSLRGKLAQYYYETITLLAHLCTFILSLQDTFENPSHTIRRIFSTAIIYLNTALVCGAIGFMFIEIYKTISQKTRASRLKQYETIAIQTGTEDILTTSEDQYLKAETNRNIDQQQASLNENDNLFTGIHQKSDNLESSEILKSNINAEDTKELDMDPSVDQSTTQIFVRRKLRVLNSKQQKNDF